MLDDEKKYVQGFRGRVLTPAQQTVLNMYPKDVCETVHQIWIRSLDVRYVSFGLKRLAAYDESDMLIRGLKYYGDGGYINEILTTAIESRSWKSVNVILKFNERVTPSIDGVIILAIEDGQYDIADILFKRGCRITRFYRKRWSNENVFVGLLRQQPYPAVARALVEYGGDPNCQGDKGVTPLHVACAAGRIDTVQYLLDVGADPNRWNRARKTALSPACRSGNIDLVHLLLKCGCNIRRDDGLAAVCVSGNIDLHRKLLQLIPEWWWERRNLKAEIFAAATNGHVDLLRILVEDALPQDCKLALNKVKDPLIRMILEKKF